MQKITLIVDANNLAHWLYYLPANQLTPAHCQRLVSQIIEYHNRYRAHLADIELCFDREQEWQQSIPDFIRIFPAAYPTTADDLVLDRFHHHQYHHHPHVIITNDEEIQRQVLIDGGLYLSVFDFAQIASNERPIFLPPTDFGFTFPTQALPAQPEAPSLRDLRHLSRQDLEETLARHGFTLSSARPLRPAPPRRQLPAQPTAIQPVAAQTPSQELTEEAIPQGPSYHLTIDRWPVEAGVRFLLQSFCGQHRDTFTTLVAEFDPRTMQPADLRVLASYLITTCGDEPGFTAQGSLMDRVRLSLLKARGGPLTLAQLVEQTGLNPLGLQGRIKEKAYPWVDILPESPKPSSMI